MGKAFGGGAVRSEDPEGNTLPAAGNKSNWSLQKSRWIVDRAKTAEGIERIRQTNITHGKTTKRAIELMRRSRHVARELSAIIHMVSARYQTLPPV